MSAAKKQASKEGQNSNNHVQQIITTYFTPRENKHKQRRPIENKPEVDTKHRTAATCASNKENISRGIKNKTLTGTKNRNEDESKLITSVKVTNNTTNPVTKLPIFQMYDYIPIPDAAETTASPVTPHSSMGITEKHMKVPENCTQEDNSEDEEDTYSPDTPSLIVKDRASRLLRRRL